ncbi:hypothetical protein [Raineyella sp. LH-20]|uniref:hypothetical protein n=1 Tax=Raineyella sp. LH-20 TaxID=3081204 RepID=UPI002954D0DB|nr:hypothetical protein [Raineyella sp. LH-20]WOP18095.1 hypothetical protein R0146_12765 [Raineyella sp. LH-20]
MTPALALTRVQLWALLVGMGGRTKTRRRWSVAVLVSIVVLITAAFSGLYSAGVAQLLVESRSADLVLVIMPAVTALGAVSASAFGVSRSVLGGRDDTLLLAQPIRPSTIALAKLAAVATQNVLLMVVSVLPTGLVCARHVAVPAWYWPALLAGTILLALATTAVSVAIALVFTVAAPRRRGRVVANIAILLVIVAATLALAPGIRHVEDLLLADPTAVRTVLGTWAAVFMALRDLALDGSPRAAGVLLVVGVVPPAAVAWLVSVAYVPLLAGRRDTAPTAHGRGRADLAGLVVRSPFAALLRRETHRFFTSTVYLVNSGFGVVLLLVGAGWLVVTGGFPAEVGSMAQVMGVPLAVLGAAVLVVPVVLTCTTAPSISLEGDRLWILRGAPIAPQLVLAAKGALNVLVVLPALLLAGVVLAVVTGAGLLDGALLLLVGALATVLVAEAGLVTNLRWPVLDAPSDAVVVKQSVSVLVAMVIGCVAGVVLTAVGLLTGRALGATSGLAAMAVAAATLDLLLFMVLRGWGVRAFLRLE